MRFPVRLTHRIYFAPGMFGFGRLASYDYFAHIEKALEARLRKTGAEVETFVVDVPPTASVRRRAARLAELVARTCEHDRGDRGPVHLLGHSTGASTRGFSRRPAFTLDVAPDALRWLPRLASVTTLSAPHHGTPLASFFATVSGQRMLYALSALTFIALSLGSPPMAAASALVLAFARLDRTLGMEIRLLDQATDALLRVLDDRRSREVRAYLDAIKEDQGAVLQLAPEAMDLFDAAVCDRERVRYQCTVSMAPPPTPAAIARAFGRPWSALSPTLFATLHGLTSRYDERYPCAVRELLPAQESALARAFGRAPGGARERRDRADALAGPRRGHLGRPRRPPRRPRAFPRGHRPDARRLDGERRRLRLRPVRRARRRHRRRPARGGETLTSALTSRALRYGFGQTPAGRRSRRDRDLEVARLARRSRLALAVVRAHGAALARVRSYRTPYLREQLPHFVVDVLAAAAVWPDGQSRSVAQPIG